ncbi:LysR substrate-binding domain-containing protein [Pseudomonas sp. R5(2019)]|uniref:LysR substrate-binding domain-containing protein n=1 Tax=Pseudomonas sp. R5(2019) TaxID=2697566 RepID=UPI001411FCC9|nr:LysR substrate-binding domain-containing protein [Pseudomonas sp. R5(2019)]NBA93761.1 LysR family transcriptional regulator [Pseudomonas sp. R5(2019)]
MENQNSLLLNNDPFLRDLLLFSTIARRSSFVSAGADLGISPAHVSKRVATLEQTLNCKLFNRTTRRVTITREGEAMLIWAKQILENVQGMLEVSHGDRVEPRGLLRISTSQRLGRFHIAPVLALLRKRYPKLEVWLELMDRRTDLTGEQFDIDIRVGDVTEQNLIAHKIASSQRILCAAPSYLAERDYPTSLTDLTQHDCLLFRDRDSSFGIWRLEGPAGMETVKVTGPMASNYSDIVREWAYEGFGIIMASTWDVAPSIDEGKLVRVLPAYRQHADVSAVTTVRASQSEKIRVCLEFLSEQLSSGPYALRGIK